MYTLGYSFRPWTDAKAIADGPAILHYMRETAREYGIDRHIRFQPPGAVGAAWSSAPTPLDGRGRSGRRPARPVAITCYFLFLCSGYYDYDEGYTPDVRRPRGFAGADRPPAALAGGPRLRGKRVVVIGSGATAVTLVPGDGRGRGARDHAAALALVHPVRARPRTAWPGASPRLPGAARPPARPLEEYRC